MCALIRLARFNVENTQEDPSHLSFAGLPSPPAAGIVVSLVVFDQDFLPIIKEWSALSTLNFDLITVWVLPLVTLMVGLLMVSRIPYPHVVNRILRGKKRFPVFLVVFFTVILGIWNIQLATLLGFSIFVFYGLIRWLISAIISAKKDEPKANDGN
jgi:phosphatidylserine synthase